MFIKSHVEKRKSSVYRKTSIKRRKSQKRRLAKYLLIAFICEQCHLIEDQRLKKRIFYVFVQVYCCFIVSSQRAAVVTKIYNLSIQQKKKLSAADYRSKSETILILLKAK